MEYYVGIDWADQEHAVCVLDQGGGIRRKFLAQHSAAGLESLCRQLTRFASADQISIALERPNGLLVDNLVDHGFCVVPIHPNVVQATRSRYRAAKVKSDPGDAYILADMLRTDGHRFRALRPQSAETRALRVVVRARDELVIDRVSAENRLRDYLKAFWPGSTKLFVKLCSGISLAFLKQHPTPSSASELKANGMAVFLAKNRYSGRRSAEELISRLRSAPSVQLEALEETARGKVVLCLVEVVETLRREEKRLNKEILAYLEQHPDQEVLTSFPRVGKVNAAQILAELGDDRTRYVSQADLAAEAGVSPVTRASGKHRGVSFRRACNKRLRRAVTCFADHSRHESQWARRIYERARARGCRHPHAVRILSRAWIRVLWRCWQNRVPYQLDLHKGALLSEPVLVRG